MPAYALRSVNELANAARKIYVQYNHGTVVVDVRSRFRVVYVHAIKKKQRQGDHGDEEDESEHAANHRC